MLGDGAFKQTAVEPLIKAVGNGFTVIIVEPIWVWLQVVELPS